MADGQNTALLGGLVQAAAGKLPSSVQDKFQATPILQAAFPTKPATATVPTLPSPSAPPEGSQFQGSGGIGAKLAAMWSSTGGKVVLIAAGLGLAWYLRKRLKRK